MGIETQQPTGREAAKSAILVHFIGEYLTGQLYGVPRLDEIEIHKAYAGIRTANPDLNITPQNLSDAAKTHARSLAVRVGVLSPQDPDYTNAREKAITWGRLSVDIDHAFFPEPSRRKLQEV